MQALLVRNLVIAWVIAIIIIWLTQPIISIVIALKHTIAWWYIVIMFLWLLILLIAYHMLLGFQDRSIVRSPQPGYSIDLVLGWDRYRSYVWGYLLHIINFVWRCSILLVLLSAWVTICKIGLCRSIIQVLWDWWSIQWRPWLVVLLLTIYFVFDTNQWPLLMYRRNRVYLLASI